MSLHKFEIFVSCTNSIQLLPYITSSSTFYAFSQCLKLITVPTQLRQRWDKVDENLLLSDNGGDINHIICPMGQAWTEAGRVIVAFKQDTTHHSIHSTQKHNLVIQSNIVVFVNIYEHFLHNLLFIIVHLIVYMIHKVKGPYIIHVIGGAVFSGRGTKLSVIRVCGGHTFQNLQLSGDRDFKIRNNTRLYTHLGSHGFYDKKFSLRSPFLKLKHSVLFKFLNSYSVRSSFVNKLFYYSLLYHYVSKISKGSFLKGEESITYELIVLIMIYITTKF